MNKRFIVILQDVSKDVEYQFIAYLNNNRIAWWHRLEGFWLLYDESGYRNAAVFRSFFTDHLRLSCNCFVITVGEQFDWNALLMLKETGENPYAWIQQYWIPPGAPVFPAIPYFPPPPPPPR